MLVSLSLYNFLVEKATNGLSTRCSVQEEAVAEVEQSKECLEHPLEFWLWIPVFCLFSMFFWVNVSVSQSYHLASVFAGPSSACQEPLLCLWSRVHRVGAEAAQECT